MHQFTSRQSRYSPDMSWQLPSSEERTMCERSKCNLELKPERGVKVKKQFGPRQKESSESSILKVESYRMKVLVGKEERSESQKAKLILDRNRRRVGLEQRKLKGLETKVLLGYSSGFVPSIKKVIIWELLD